MKEKLRQLPSIDSLLKDHLAENLLNTYTYERVKVALQQEIDQARTLLLEGKDISIQEADIIDRADSKLSQLNKESLQAVINGTGTVLHTNLGRALLSDQAVEAVLMVAKDYNNLEYSLEQGKRGTRYEHLEGIIKELTGAEAALVVNNNAAAVMLILTAFTKGKEVLISRGELVEIGGSFRIPEVIASGGAILHEVGSTNKTHLRDYQAGINEETGALLRVHTSNYRLVGFTEKVDDRDLVELGHQHNLPVFNDLGSGLLIDLQSIGLSYEPTVKEMIEVGYDLVSFSGDKLLGGPQAGIIVGKKVYIDQLKSHPLLRALRTDKMTIAALEATLRHYLSPEKAIQEIPTLRMIGMEYQELQSKAELLIEGLKAIPEVTCDIIQGTSQVGGGAYPGEYIPTLLVSIQTDKISEASFEEQLRLSDKHIIARINEGQLQLDVRTILDSQISIVVEEIKQILTY